tara:strand:- start:2495 stop:2734 length:240 start_codon:yes stop_codon:yes gene_type:complete
MSSIDFTSTNPTPPKRIRARVALENAKAALKKAAQMKAEADALVGAAHQLGVAAQAEIDSQEPPKPKAKAKAKAKAKEK